MRTKTKAAKSGKTGVDMGAIFSQRNATLAKSAKTDPTLRQFKHKHSPLTGRFAVIAGKTYREVRHPVHGCYWTVKAIAGLDKPVTASRPVVSAPTVNASAPAVKLELLRMQLQLLSEMKAMLA